MHLLRELADEAMEAAGLQTMATVEKFERWEFENTLPSIVKIEAQWLAALKLAIGRIELKDEPENRLVEPPPIHESEVSDDRKDLRPSVVMFGRGQRPAVFGRFMPPIRPNLYPALKEIVDAFPMGTPEGSLSKIHPDSVEMLHELRETDPDWAAALLAPHRAGGQWRLAPSLRDEPRGLTVTGDTNLSKSSLVYVARLDGVGEDPVDLSRCSRFALRDPRTDPDGELLTYYLTSDGKWIEHSGSACPYEGDWLETFSEVEPVRAAHNHWRLNNMTLPKSLEEYRE